MRVRNYALCLCFTVAQVIYGDRITYKTIFVLHSPVALKNAKEIISEGKRNNNNKQKRE